MSEVSNVIDIRGIMKMLPHRYPFLLVDRVLEIEEGKRIKAIKNVTANEQFFVGHFEQYPVMPGVLIIEALAQAAGILAIKTHDGEVRQENALYFFVGVLKIKGQIAVVGIASGLHGFVISAWLQHTIHKLAIAQVRQNAVERLAAQADSAGSG